MIERILLESVEVRIKNSALKGSNLIFFSYE